MPKGEIMDKKIKILLVDDEPDFTNQMAFWLKGKGYTVSVASDGERAIKVIKEDAPDIVFMDLNMPVMDGVQAVKKIREFNKDIPLIVISAYLEDERVRDVGSYGISGVFCKGTDFKESLVLLEAAHRTHKKLQ
jgi:CheY-like chemotaxis protein